MAGVSVLLTTIMVSLSWFFPRKNKSTLVLEDGQDWYLCQNWFQLLYPRKVPRKMWRHRHALVEGSQEVDSDPGKQMTRPVICKWGSHFLQCCQQPASPDKFLYQVIIPVCNVCDSPKWIANVLSLISQERTNGKLLVGLQVAYFLSAATRFV